MYCKMYGIANGAILKKKKLCKSLVELYSAILVRFSIFSIQVALIVLVPVYTSTYQDCTYEVYVPVQATTCAVQVLQWVPVQYLYCRVDYTVIPVYTGTYGYNIYKYGTCTVQVHTYIFTNSSKYYSEVSIMQIPERVPTILIFCTLVSA